MSLCLARVTATLIRRWSSNSRPTCGIRNGREGRRRDGRGVEEREGERKGPTDKMRPLNDVQVHLLTCLSGLLLTKETMMHGLSLPWYRSTV